MFEKADRVADWRLIDYFLTSRDAGFKYIRDAFEKILNFKLDNGTAENCKCGSDDNSSYSSNTYCAAALTGALYIAPKEYFLAVFESKMPDNISLKP